MLRAAILAALLTCACTPVQMDGPDAQGYRWELARQPLRATVHRGVDVYLQCGQERHALSCARRNEDAGTCDIYLPPSPKPWQEGHEARHCAGWTHPSNELMRF